MPSHTHFSTMPCSYGIVYIIFVLLGTGTLLPWNVFLTEKASDEPSPQCMNAASQSHCRQQPSYSPTGC